MADGGLNRDMTAELRADLDQMARACRVFELEGHGDRVVGHMAMRDPEGRGFWMKRAGISLGEVYDARDFVLLDFDGRKLAGDGRRHGEWPIHGEILRARPDIKATAHTHPFYASVYSACDEPLRTVVPRATTQPVRPPRWEGSADLIATVDAASSMVDAMGAHYAVLLRNHGIVTCGPDIADPVLVGIALEKMCREALCVASSGLDYSCPEEDELVEKMESGAALDPAIASGRVQWRYYQRKLARAEAAGDPAFARAPVPID
ncbi:MAG: class II aldolase/adducin family protein [Alphaproteobacteria bacterium]